MTHSLNSQLLDSDRVYTTKGRIFRFKALCHGICSDVRLVIDTVSFNVSSADISDRI